MDEEAQYCRRCSAPDSNEPHIPHSRFCCQEKWEWVREHLGDEFLDRVILTRDKTVVRADLLVDDKPRITGAQHVSIPNGKSICFSGV